MSKESLEASGGGASSLLPSPVPPSLLPSLFEQIKSLEGAKRHLQCINKQLGAEVIKKMRKRRGRAKQAKKLGGGGVMIVQLDKISNVLPVLS